MTGYCANFGSDGVPIADIVLSFGFMDKDNYDNTLIFCL